MSLHVFKSLFDKSLLTKLSLVCYAHFFNNAFYCSHRTTRIFDSGLSKDPTDRPTDRPMKRICRSIYVDQSMSRLGAWMVNTQHLSIYQKQIRDVLPPMAYTFEWRAPHLFPCLIACIWLWVLSSFCRVFSLQFPSSVFPVCNFQVLFFLFEFLSFGAQYSRQLSILVF